MEKKTIKDIGVEGKRLLVRVDFNVPLDKSTGAITSDNRIRAALPTIRYLVDRGAKVILCSHLGRPKGEVKEDLRMASIGERLSELLGRSVNRTLDCIGPEVEQAIGEMHNGDLLLLENVRFHPEEEKNDPKFAAALASLADIYVNDAFGTAHRAHASTAGVAACLPAVAGLLMEKELEFLDKALADPLRPFAMIIGGAKVGDKIGLLENISGKIDVLIIGGGMANTFSKAQGYDVGKSKVEDDRLDFARNLIDKAAKMGLRLLLPTDAVVAEEFKADSAPKIVPLGEVPNDWLVLDIGPETTQRFCDELKHCKTIVWNGPMGVFEFPAFAQGTQALASFISELDAMTIIGGGDTVAVVDEIGLSSKMTHVSTGGGASLELLEGKTLPGLAVLLDKDED